MAIKPKKDIQTVSVDGKPIRELISGASIHPVTTHSDERGNLCELFNPAWGITDDAVVYVYQVTTNPGKVRGWTLHRKQEDRIFASTGTLKFVLYDGREDSPSFGRINELVLGELNRSVLTIPMGVFHAVQNVGPTMAVFINMPTVPYNHEDPDKYRIPLDNDLIPYRFEDRPGWCDPIFAII